MKPRKYKKEIWENTQCRTKNSNWSDKIQAQKSSLNSQSLKWLIRHKILGVVKSRLKKKYGREEKSRVWESVFT